MLKFVDGVNGGRDCSRGGGRASKREFGGRRRGGVDGERKEGSGGGEGGAQSLSFLAAAQSNKELSALPLPDEGKVFFPEKNQLLNPSPVYACGFRPMNLVNRFEWYPVSVQIFSHPMRTPF